MKWFSKIFFRGLTVLVPLGVTVYVVYWCGAGTEALMGNLFTRALPGAGYFPGLGLATAVVLVFIAGLLIHFWLLRALFSLGERLLQKIPLVKTLYGSMQDLMSFFSRPGKKKLDKVVMVTIGGTNLRLMGLVMREDFDDLPDEIGTGETVAVYLPMSYQIGGFTTMVPRADVQSVDMSVEEAMRFTLTAGMSITAQRKQKSGREIAG